MPPGTLAIREETEGERRTLVLSGELDLVTAPALERAIAQATDTDLRELVLDVREVVFVDSSGFRALLGAKELCRELNLGFAMTRGPETVQRMFDIAGVLKRLPFV